MLDSDWKLLKEEYLTLRSRCCDSFQLWLFFRKPSVNCYTSSVCYKMLSFYIVNLIYLGKYRKSKMRICWLFPFPIIFIIKNKKFRLTVITDFECQKLQNQILEKFYSNCFHLEPLFGISDFQFQNHKNPLISHFIFEPASAGTLELFYHSARVKLG